MRSSAKPYGGDPESGDDEDEDGNAVRAAVVFDDGTYRCRVGFSGEAGPRHAIPCVVGRPRRPELMYGLREGIDTLLGEEATTKRAVLNLMCPLGTGGTATDWDDMERIWHHAFYSKLMVPPEDQPVLVIEAPLNPKVQSRRRG